MLIDLGIVFENNILNKTDLGKTVNLQFYNVNLLWPEIYFQRYKNMAQELSQDIKKSKAKDACWDSAANSRVPASHTISIKLWHLAPQKVSSTEPTDCR